MTQGQALLRLLAHLRHRVANHRNGGRDPTELALTVQPANTAPVGVPPAWARDLREQSTGPFAPSNQRPAPWFVS